VEEAGVDRPRLHHMREGIRHRTGLSRLVPTRPTRPGVGQPSQPRKDRFLHPINSDYDLYSMGKDGESVEPLTAQKSHDDVIRANDGSFVGLAVEF
jgi:hypothetical protein